MRTNKNISNQKPSFIPQRIKKKNKLNSKVTEGKE